MITTTHVKAVGYVAVRFAGWNDGAEIRPGNALLARILGCSVKSVERAFGVIRDLGMMWRYHKGCRDGDADVYRLTVPGEAFGTLPLLTEKWEYPDLAPDSQSGAD